jgi:hypothetical protein
MMDSISSAVQGVVVQPVEGFDREGGVGFAKGVAKGVAGYVFSFHHALTNKQLAFL